MRRPVQVGLTWCAAGVLIAGVAHAQVGVAPAGSRTITVAWPGSAPQTGLLLSVTGLPVGGAPGDDPGAPSSGGQGKPRANGITRPPQGPIVIMVSDAGPLGALMLRARQCLAVGQRCPFDATLATPGGTFIAQGASATQFQVVSSPTGGSAYQVTLATSALTRQ